MCHHVGRVMAASSGLNTELFFTHPNTFYRHFLFINQNCSRSLPPPVSPSLPVRYTKSILRHSLTGSSFSNCGRPDQISPDVMSQGMDCTWLARLANAIRLDGPGLGSTWRAWFCLDAGIYDKHRRSSCGRCKVLQPGAGSFD